MHQYQDETSGAPAVTIAALTTVGLGAVAWVVALPADDRRGHDDSRSRIVHILYQHVDLDDGRDDAAGRGSGSLQTRACQRLGARNSAVRRAVPCPEGPASESGHRRDAGISDDRAWNLDC